MGSRYRIGEPPYWSDDRRQKLRELYWEHPGWSAREFAKAMGYGCTRSMILGKLWRMRKKKELDMDVAEAGRKGGLASAAKRMSQPHHKRPKPVVECDAPRPIATGHKPNPDFPDRCSHPGCRNTAQKNVRHYCAECNSKWLEQHGPRLRANMREVGVGTTAGVAI